MELALSEWVQDLAIHQEYYAFIVRKEEASGQTNSLSSMYGSNRYLPFGLSC